MDPLRENFQSYLASQNQREKQPTHRCNNFYLFAIEADGGGRVDVLVELEAVEDCRFSGRVQADHGTVVGAEIGQSVCERRYRFFSNACSHFFSLS